MEHQWKNVSSKRQTAYQCERCGIYTFEKPAQQPDETLLAFYQVTDYPSLVAAMKGHIKKMQSKLPVNPQTAIDAWNNREMMRDQPASKPLTDKRLKVKIGSQYGGDLTGHWFYLQPADEFAEAALAKHTGIEAAHGIKGENNG